MDTPIEDLAFEDALKELELIVGKLESGDTPLQQAIELYERGNKLRQRCADRALFAAKGAGRDRSRDAGMLPIAA